MIKKTLLTITIGTLFFIICSIILVAPTDNPIPAQNNTSNTQTHTETKPPLATLDRSKVTETVYIDTQKVLVYYPHDTDATTQALIYSHGSNESILEETPTPPGFAEALDIYSDYFTKNNFVFIVSEMYGANWGNADSVIHLNNLTLYAQNRWQVEQVNLFAFSMGALPALRYATRYPEHVATISLLAPSIHAPDWGSAARETIQDVPLTIWHGTNDVNIDMSFSKDFVALMKKDNNSPPVLHLVNGQAHSHFLHPSEVVAFIASTS